MNIEDKIVSNIVEFSHVPSGEIFLHEDAYYLAIDTLEDDYSHTVNAINLSDGDGKGVFFDDDDRVVLVKATLTIESR